MSGSPGPRSAADRRRELALRALVVLGLLLVVHLWPLATDPAHLSRVDNADTRLNAWIVCWVAHALTTDPLNLFNANIFHPQPLTLAYSEPLVVPGLLAIPLRLAGAGPILAYNVLLMAGMVLTGLGGYLLVRRLTGDHLAGLVSGSLLAFNGYTLSELPHLQTQWAVWVPLALLFLDRLLESGRIRDAVGLGLCCTATAWTSGHYSVFLAYSIGVSLIAWLPVAVRSWPWSRWVRLGLAGGLSALLSAPVLWAYWRVGQDTGFDRPLDAVSGAPLHGYLSTVSRLHFSAWSHRFFGSGSALFPGIVALVLAGLATATWFRVRNAVEGRRRASFALIGLVGLVLSLGPTGTPLYEWAYALFPPMRGIRDAARFGWMFLFAIVVLAGFGVVELRRRCSSRRSAAAALAAVLVIVNVENLTAPNHYVRFEGFSPIYSRMADLRESAVVAEFPFASSGPPHSWAVLRSTEHWKPIVNGYSGIFPPDIERRTRRLTGFPDRRSLRELGRLGVTHVLVHTRAYPNQRRQALRKTLKRLPGFRLIDETEDRIQLYRVHPRAYRKRDASE